jgi:hypothetical protein
MLTNGENTDEKVFEQPAFAIHHIASRTPYGVGDEKQLKGIKKSK